MRRFERTPHELLRDRTISLQARAVYPILRDLIWEETGDSGVEVRGILPTLEELAASIGCSRTALKGYVDELRKAGWLTTVRRQRDRPQLYILHASRGAESDLRDEGRRAESDPPVGRNPTHPLYTDDSDTTRANALVHRRRDLVFEALTEATHANVSAARGELNAAAKAIRTAMETTITDLRHAYLARSPEADDVPADILDERIADEIRARAEAYAQRRPEWELTPGALAKHWNRIPTWKQSAGGDRMRPEDIAGMGR